MIILDTNVVSELGKATRSGAVVKWAENQRIEDLFITSVTKAEIYFGIERLSAGKKRKLLEETVKAHFDTEFRGRILPFGEESAASYAIIRALRFEMARPISTLDNQIAAIVRAQGAKLATRNIRDFEHCGIELIDPWR